MLSQLKKICASDVTWVECLDREQVDRLCAEERHCLSPCIASRLGGVQFPGLLNNGTLSLSLKHKAAYVDMEVRSLASAVVLEDDAFLPHNLWSLLGVVVIPGDAALYFLGSYSTWHGGTLESQSVVRHPKEGQRWVQTLSGQQQDSARKVRQGTPYSVPTIRRDMYKEPKALGGVGYIVFARGARILAHRPVIAAADIEIAWVKDVPNNTNARSQFVASAMVIENDAGCHEFRVSPPLQQYGPRRWFVYPQRDGFWNDSDKGGSHSRAGRASI